MFFFKDNENTNWGGRFLFFFLVSFYKHKRILFANEKNFVWTYQLSHGLYIIYTMISYHNLLTTCSKSVIDFIYDEQWAAFRWLSIPRLCSLCDVLSTCFFRELCTSVFNLLSNRSKTRDTISFIFKSAVILWLYYTFFRYV